MPVRVEAMRRLSQNRFPAQCVALLLLLAIVAVVVAPMVNLPRCANRAQEAAAMFQWLLTCAVLAISAVLSMRAVRELTFLRLPAANLEFPGHCLDTAGAVLLC